MDSVAFTLPISCLLIGVFRSFTVNVAIGVLGLKSTSLFFIFYFALFLCFPFPVSSWVTHVVLKFHLYLYVVFLSISVCIAPLVIVVALHYTYKTSLSPPMSSSYQFG